MQHNEIRYFEINILKQNSTEGTEISEKESYIHFKLYCPRVQNFEKKIFCFMVSTNCTRGSTTNMLDFTFPSLDH